MNELENKELENPTPAAESEVNEPITEFQNNEVEPAAEPAVEPETVVEQEVETPAEPTEFEVLQQKFEDLQNSYNELQDKFSATENRISEIETAKNAEIESLRAENEKLQFTIATYQAAEVKIEEEKKENLIKNYEKYLDEEEIKPYKDMVKDFSYETLEGKLAIAFANKQMVNGEEIKKVPLPEHEDNEFANFMKKYKK